MKTFFYLSLLFFISCSGKKEPSFKELQLSKTQIVVQNLLDSFKLEYSRAENTVLQTAVINTYNLKLFNFLGSSHDNRFYVHIDSVTIQGRKITTKFHCKNIAFQYGMIFKKELDKDWDSIYHFMKGLKVGTDTTINFVYMGSHQLNDPLDSMQPVLKIFAFPTPYFLDEK